MHLCVTVGDCCTIFHYRISHSHTISIWSARLLPLAATLCTHTHTHTSVQQQVNMSMPPPAAVAPELLYVTSLPRIDDDSEWVLANEAIGGALPTNESSTTVTMLHENSGWTICAEVSVDYYTYIPAFVATHASFGQIDATCNDEIRATSQQAWDHFRQYHQFERFCVGDIWHKAVQQI